MINTTNWEPISQKVIARSTSIPGLYEFQLDVHGDNRGWFKENYQREKLLAALRELNDPHASAFEAFTIIQNNISFNKEKGVTRGFHAEPWEKFISIACGEAFAAIVDLRKGQSFGNVETFQMTPNTALFVPRGCGNSFQALTDNLVYTYLVNAHYSQEAKYVFANLRDPQIGVQWPLPIQDDKISEKDKNHPMLKDVLPMEV